MTKDSKKPNPPKKSDRLQKYWSHQRMLLNILLIESEEYKDAIEKGLPFFTTEELSELDRKYENGITWKQIDTELSKKGMIFKQSTFRKYIQEQKIPPAKGYISTDKGREAIYPSNIIQHINIIQYFFRVAGNEFIDKLIDIYAEQTVNASDAIKGQLEHQNLYSGVLTYLRGMSWEGDDIEQAINDVLGHDPVFKAKALSGLAKVFDDFNQKFNQWANMLEKYKIPVSELK
jgi:hypothetical protein